MGKKARLKRERRLARAAAPRWLEESIEMPVRTGYEPIDYKPRSLGATTLMLGEPTIAPGVTSADFLRMLRECRERHEADNQAEMERLLSLGEGTDGSR